MAEKTREVKALENKVKTLENDLSLDKPLDKSGEFYGPIFVNQSEIFGDPFKLYMNILI